MTSVQPIPIQAGAVGELTDRAAVIDPVDLQSAIENGRLHLVFQPEIDLGTGKLLGLEALLRWDDEALTPNSIEALIVAAEMYGFMPELGDRIFDSACDQLAQWTTDLPDFDWSLRINVSATQLTPEFLDRIATRLRSGDIRAKNLGIELTEQVGVRDVGALSAVVQKIRDLGVTAALDDVGTGYNSLSRVTQLPVDMLKIDQSFVTGLADEPLSHAIVDAVVLIGTQLGLEVVAEGVETADVAQLLLAAGCHRAQGYLFGRPVRPEELCALLRAGQLVDTALPFGHW